MLGHNLFRGAVLKDHNRAPLPPKLAITRIGGGGGRRVERVGEIDCVNLKKHTITLCCRKEIVSGNFVDRIQLD